MQYCDAGELTDLSDDAILIIIIERAKVVTFCMIPTLLQLELFPPYVQTDALPMQKVDIFSVSLPKPCSYDMFSHIGHIVMNYGVKASHNR